MLPSCRERSVPLAEVMHIEPTTAVVPISAPDDMETWRILLGGRVQGVGFRPFVYCLASELGLTGEVRNQLGTVHVVASGNFRELHEFRQRLIGDAPPLAQPAVLTTQLQDHREFAGFVIRESTSSEQAMVFVPPDNFCCDECLRELNDSTNRRYRYPFINCTQCGPRYTLIESLPYDRPNTTMAGFSLCAPCEREYKDPGDRRFHAEPIACPECGPQVSFRSAGGPEVDNPVAALEAALVVLADGGIVAVKGIGGYHLLCDARNARAVERLRIRKCRPDKPLAVMFPLGAHDDCASVRKSVSLTYPESELLRSSARPIVLAARRDDCPLALNIAPGLDELGVFLPYSPLHSLLLQDFGAPLVATSGNVSGEPVLIDNEVAQLRLSAIADAFLHHNRPIVRPADDSVYRRCGASMRPLRIGRGVSPLETTIPWRQLEPVICVGGQQKTTVTLSWDDRAVVSPHIGEMGSPRSLEVFEQVVSSMQSLYGVEAKRIVCDAHTAYTTSRWAQRQQLPVASVWHHRAHASALVAEVALPGPWLVFTWDGVGLGEDGSLWGGEALLGDAGHWRRVCSFRPFCPPGGDRAGRQPWRSAAALCWDSGMPLPFERNGMDIAHAAWRNKLNSPESSAVGRLFDAAAAMVCGLQDVSFEAQGPMMLEALCEDIGRPTSLPLQADASGVLRTDWEPLLTGLLDTRQSEQRRAQDFHSSMALAVCEQAQAVRKLHGDARIGLCGGVFQNRVLAEQTIMRLQQTGFSVHLPVLLPCNDASLGFGQAAEWAARQFAEQTNGR